MDKVSKFLQEVSLSERKRIDIAISKIITRDLKDLDVKKLQGTKDLYRARVGPFRIIFTHIPGDATIISVDRRDENTYKF